eukprot:1444295-Pleurochrysis_carterae.AAC.1
MKIERAFTLALVSVPCLSQAVPGLPPAHYAAAKKAIFRTSPGLVQMPARLVRLRLALGAAAVWLT